MQKIGFIGVGKIGTEIVKHLLAAGYEVIGHRRTSLAEFQKIGGTPAASASEVGEQADIVFSCLPGGDALDEVVDGPHGLVHTARAGQIVVELGSHPLPAKERQIKRLAPKGAIFLDGEVSGTPGMVALRKAPIYLAGDAEACQKIEPIVKTFTELCLYLGSFGTAGKIKFVNNLLVVVNTAAIGEAVALALNAGVEPEMMIKTISSGSGGSVLFPIRARRMVRKDYHPPQGTFEELIHYFDYIDDLARTTKTSTPLFWLAADLFRRGIEHGLAKHDVSAIIEVVHQISSEQKKRRKSKQSD
jgi:3-hydroxyisobutyrate dehydrogenase-like beta-hydroxyacid dehydrogenase